MSLKVLKIAYDVPCLLSCPDAGVGPLDRIRFTGDRLLKVMDELLELRKEGHRLRSIYKFE